MRRWVVAFWLIGLVSDASAGELGLPTLRGSNFTAGTPQYFNWSGFYGGGHGVYSASGMDFAGSTSTLIAYILRNTTIEDTLHASTWTTLPRTSTSGTGYGGFIGYNTQWDDAVLGAEISYNHVQLYSSATDIISRFMTQNNVKYSATINSAASLRITDFATVRGRAGYAMGQFLPYVTLGATVARANIVRSATVTELEYDVTDAANPILIGGIGTVTRNENKNGTFIFGYSASLGMDVMILPNLFARAEWEYVKFQNIDGIMANINSARVGMGLKF